MRYKETIVFESTILDGWTNREVARRLGVDESYISMFRHNRRIARKALYDKMCAVLVKGS